MGITRLLTLLWAGGLAFLCLLAGWAPGFIFAMVPAPIVFYSWLGVGGVLVIISGILASRRKHSAAAVYLDPGIIFILVAAGLAWWFQADLARYGDHLHYRRYRPAYQAVVDSVTTASPRRVEWADAPFGSFVIDTGPPIRVAFRRSSWLGDWEGIIFDPTDSLLSWEEHSPHRSIKLFDRAVVGCSRREPKWFDCGTLRDQEKP